MHEKRNFVLILLWVCSIGWSAYAWLMQPESSFLPASRAASLVVMVGLGAWLYYAMQWEDKLPDHLRQMVGSVYYEAEGLSFMPMIRMRKGHAELCVFYQNRYEGPVEAIVHLRPPERDSFVIRQEARDVHFAFKAAGGDFGAIHQSIGVPRNVQGEVIEVLMAASSWYPRGKGAKLRSQGGIPSGTLVVDWAGAALKVGVHEVGEGIKLTNPVRLHMAMPLDVSDQPHEREIWRQERLAEGAVAMA